VASESADPHPEPDVVETQEGTFPESSPPKMIVTLITVTTLLLRWDRPNFGNLTAALREQAEQCFDLYAVCRRMHVREVTNAIFEYRADFSKWWPATILTRGINGFSIEHAGRRSVQIRRCVRFKNQSNKIHSEPGPDVLTAAESRLTMKMSKTTPVGFLVPVPAPGSGSWQGASQ
jgi:hypothetical protein